MASVLCRFLCFVSRLVVCYRSSSPGRVFRFALLSHPVLRPGTISDHPLRPSSRRAQLSFRIACWLRSRLKSPGARTGARHCKYACSRRILKTNFRDSVQRITLIFCEVFELLRKLLRVRTSRLNQATQTASLAEVMSQLWFLKLHFFSHLTADCYAIPLETDISRDTVSISCPTEVLKRKSRLATELRDKLPLNIIDAIMLGQTGQIPA
jgi:hypothetical protein